MVMKHSDVKGKYLDPNYSNLASHKRKEPNLPIEIDWLKENHLHNVEELTISEILWKGKHNKYITSDGGSTCSCCNGERFRKANWKDFPIWLMKYNCIQGEKYIIMDGRHRLRKAMADGETTIKGYVYSLDELLNYFKE
tara:strand:- start:138 stop:554 length:417 start_codon:yes stop_codon:yes gene_type:complete